MRVVKKSGPGKKRTVTKTTSADGTKKKYVTKRKKDGSKSEKIVSKKKGEPRKVIKYTQKPGGKAVLKKTKNVQGVDFVY